LSSDLARQDLGTYRMDGAERGLSAPRQCMSRAIP
jgi:hypothetical protein